MPSPSLSTKLVSLVYAMTDARGATVIGQVIGTPVAKLTYRPQREASSGRSGQVTTTVTSDGLAKIRVYKLASAALSGTISTFANMTWLPGAIRSKYNLAPISRVTGSAALMVLVALKLKL